MAADVYDPAHKTAEVRRWLDEEAHRAAAEDPHHGQDPNRHDRGIHAFCLTFGRPLDWSLFGIWLSMLLHAHGERVLRVKGILNVLGLATPVVIHGVQHVIHPPAHLEGWPSADRRSRIVFIVRGLEQKAIERSLAAFSRQAEATGPVS
jgi:G3E family GTPase